MIEDDIYRSSTQFRLWSFTRDSLASMRATTNKVASERIRAAQKRAREAAAQHRTANTSPDTTSPTSGSGNATPNPTSDAEGKTDAILDQDVKCLTPEEEAEFVRYYCEQTLELGDTYKPPLPTMVRATAIQYLRRFYLTNSVMVYHPKSIMPCALFLATKTDNYYMSLKDFASGVPGVKAPEEVIAPEFTLTQGLRFTFDVRHPFRGLEGGIMELQAIAQGNGKPNPHHMGQTPESLKRDLHAIPPASPTDPQTSITNRISIAHGKAREILKTAAQVTDAYFFYTPSQIWLAALFLADRPLAQYYLDIKIGPVVESGDADPKNPLAMIRMKLLTTLADCAKLLESYAPMSSDPEARKRLKGIAKKVYQCHQILKLDPASPGGGQKRGEGMSESDRERAAKKRKLERERREQEARELFGGELSKPAEAAKET